MIFAVSATCRDADALDGTPQHFAIDASGAFMLVTGIARRRGHDDDKPLKAGAACRAREYRASHASSAKWRRYHRRPAVIMKIFTFVFADM